MKLTGTKLKQVKSRLITGKIMDLLDRKGLLSKIEHLGMKNWNGKQVMVNQLTALTMDEQTELEKEINEQVDMMI
jgi:hypothetical protein